MKVYLVYDANYDYCAHIVAFSSKESADAFAAIDLSRGTVDKRERRAVEIEEIEIDPTQPTGAFGVQLDCDGHRRCYWSWTATPGAFYVIKARERVEAYGNTTDEAVQLARRVLESGEA